VARRSHPGRRLGLRGILLQIGQLQLELVQQCAAFRGLAEPFVPQLADRDLSFSISCAWCCASLSAAIRVARSATSIDFSVSTSSGRESAVLIAYQGITSRRACPSRRIRCGFKMLRSAVSGVPFPHFGGALVMA
jgi:hypothetical protein